MIHITLPGMAPILILLGVLSLGGILNAGFEQILIMYNPTVYEGADIIDTFVYRLGMFSQQFDRPPPSDCSNPSFPWFWCP